jgi:hypothetical protein
MGHALPPDLAALLDGLLAERLLGRYGVPELGARPRAPIVRDQLADSIARRPRRK